MKVLVACEYSGVVREAFAVRGHDAWSCDLLPTERPGQHFKSDVFLPLEVAGPWDLLIAHPPCTCIAVSGNAHYAKGKDGWQKRLNAISFVERLWNQPAKRICLENPVGVLPTMSSLGKASQYIQPWQFGHSESKRTGLWLKELPLLVSTNVLPLPACGYWDNQTPEKQNKLMVGGKWIGFNDPRTAHLRAKTYQGIADAMAEQWGAL